MGSKNIGKSALQSFTGGIEKAIIEIEDNRPKPNKKPTVENPEPRKSTDAGLGQISNNLSEAAKNVANVVAKKSDAVSDKLPVTNVVNKMQEKAAESLPKKKRFVVKFNPSQITFQGAGGGKVEKRDYEVEHPDPEHKVDISYQEMQTRIQMNLQLIFDDYERTQAFMSEKGTDVSAWARTGIVGIANAVTKRTYSVRPQVEGFIGALINPYTRKISFSWGSMEYAGVLNYVNVEYTMFSTDGNPIRAIVNLGILLVDETLDYKSMGQWQNSYMQVFGKGDQTNLGNAMQNVGNLLNINL